MTEDDRRSRRVILLDPPPTDRNLIVTLPDGTSFRPLELAACPVCRGDFKLGNGEFLHIEYLGVGRVVIVCRKCASKPPADYRERLRIALDSFPWCKLDHIELEASLFPR